MDFFSAFVSMPLFVSLFFPHCKCSTFLPLKCTSRQNSLQTYWKINLDPSGFQSDSLLLLPCFWIQAVEEPFPGLLSLGSLADPNRYQHHDKQGRLGPLELQPDWGPRVWRKCLQRLQKGNRISVKLGNCNSPRSQDLGLAS